MVSPLAPEEGAAVSKNVGEGQGSTVGRPAGRLRHMHGDVAEFLRLAGARRRQTKKPAPAAEREEEWGERARYRCAFEDEGECGGFAVPHRLVWVKVKGYPWWPGQVFDPADASELALGERRRRGAALVACFWDKTFAWVANAAALRPFRAGFPRLSRNGMVVSAVDAALGEVARRVDAGLSCCCAAGSSDGVASKKQVFENTGVWEGAYGAVVDAAFTRNAFRGEAFVECISALAMAPLAEADRLDLTIATAQLKAFTRWRGTRGLPEYTACYGIEDIANGSMEAAAPACRATAKRRRSRGEDGDNADACAGKWSMSRCNRARSENAACENVDDALELEDFEPSPQPLSHQMSTKMGKLMGRAAQQMSQPTVIHRANCNAPQVVSGLMTRCTRAAGPAAPSVKLQNGGLKDELVLNFTGPSAVPPTSDLVKIFSQFGPIKEARTEHSVAVVIFKRSADAETAFSGTTKISALSANLISFRLTYSLPAAAPVDPPQSTLNTDGKDQLPVEVVQ